MGCVCGYKYVTGKKTPATNFSLFSGINKNGEKLKDMLDRLQKSRREAPDPVEPQVPEEPPSIDHRNDEPLSEDQIQQVQACLDKLFLSLEEVSPPQHTPETDGIDT